MGEAPLLTKESYVKQWSLADRCWGGTLQGVSFVHCSSGSTGEPTLWARTLHAELAVACTFERVFRDAFAAHERSTLAVILFPLGSWVGGLFTTMCVNYLTIKGYKIALATPGNRPEDVLKIVPDLSPNFEQTILLGYPPFVKGVVDAGRAAGVDWAAFNLGVVLAGEVFSEEWRQLVADRAGIKAPQRRIVSLYGTADAGVIAAESEANELFAAERLPTLCQYDPNNRLLDVVPQDGTLAVTCLMPPEVLPRGAATPCGGALELCGPPTIKYAIGDVGGVIAFADMLAFLAARGMDVDALLAGKCVRKLPFVWLLGRSFWCVSIGGANVYVENVMVGMEQPEVAEHVTGKFVLLVEEDAELNKRLAIVVECAPKCRVDPAVRDLISEHVTAQLCRLNSEYANYVPSCEQAVRVHLREYGDKEMFPIGVKHKYTK